jgi:glycosyltransferase involved in cell wall biosynthesis
MRRVFREWGLASELFSERARILPELRGDARDIADAPAACGAQDVALLHLSIGSPVNEAFAALRCRKVILYHNITPPHFFTFVNPRTAANLARGRDQARALAGVADVTLADSRYNARELEAMGYRDIAVLPLMLNMEEVYAPPDPRVLRRFRDGRFNMLFVGRCVPNKKIEDLLDTFAVFCRAVTGEARLIHVGSHAGSERYYHLLVARARELGLEHVHFAGSVPQAALTAYYEAADVFLCLSEHEGFCIPVLESMMHGVPVAAYAAAAVPETMDGAGILFREKRLELIAETLGRLHGDDALRDAVREGQRQRVARYRARDLSAELRHHLAPLLGDRPS